MVTECKHLKLFAILLIDYHEFSDFLSIKVPVHDFLNIGNLNPLA